MSNGRPIPTARRLALVHCAMAVWSAVTAICGLAQTFVSIATARLMVGVREAGATPPAYSVIADFNPRDRRAFSSAIYGMGALEGVSLLSKLFFHLAPRNLVVAMDRAAAT